METVKESPGFEWIPSQSEHPYVSIDKNNRLYISRPARDLFHVPAGSFLLQVGFDSANRRMGISRPYSTREMPSPYKFDKRAYTKASYFVERASLKNYLPCRFLYLGLSEDVDPNRYPPGVHIFELAENVHFEA